MTRAKTTLFKDKEGQREPNRGPPLYAPVPAAPPADVRNIAHYGKDAYTTTQKYIVCRHTRPLGRLSTVRSLTRSCTCDNGEGSLTMQPPPTLHMGLHLTHEWHVASPQKRPLCTLSRHLFFLRKSE